MRRVNRQVRHDRAYLWRANAFRKPFFYGGLDTPPLPEHVRAIDLELPKLPSRGRVAFRADTLAGDMRAALHVHTLEPGAPALIFHHAAGEHPPDRMLDAMFPPRQTKGLTIIAVEAPLHARPSEHQEASASLLVYLAMLAVPIAATERLVETKPVADARLRAVVGFDQGGYIANWHHLIFDSADLYLPFMAGTAHADMLLASFKVAAPVRRHPERLQRLLNCDGEWAGRDHGNVFPVLGSADLINPFDVQAPSYGETPIEVWGAGHIDTARNPERMREKILRHISEPTPGPHHHEAAERPALALVHAMRARA
jgi:hypothetical protein